MLLEFTVVFTGDWQEVRGWIVIVFQKKCSNSLETVREDFRVK